MRIPTDTANLSPRHPAALPYTGVVLASNYRTFEIEQQSYGAGSGNGYRITPKGHIMGDGSPLTSDRRGIGLGLGNRENDHFQNNPRLPPLEVG